MTLRAADFWYDFDEDLPIEQRADEAKRMVEAFVNAFTRETYAVTFAPGAIGGHIAYTNWKAKTIYVNPAPLFDKSLSIDEQADILSGLACHEISHTRYGKQTFEAVRLFYPNSSNAHALGNLLDDIRIERRFSAAYPGFADVFKSPMAWVSSLNAGSKPTSGLDIAVRATRYDSTTDWTDTDPAERQWWQDWGERWSQSDEAPELIKGVSEGLQHLAEAQQQQQGGDTQDGEQEDGDDGEPMPSDGQSDGEQESQNNSNNQQSGDSGDDSESNESGESSESGEPDESGSGSGGSRLYDDSDDAPQSTSVDSCASHAVDNVLDAQEQYDQQQFEYQQSRDESFKTSEGDTVKVYNRTFDAKPNERYDNPQITRSVRDAIARSRTGVGAPMHNQKHGSINNNALHRIAFGDADLFTRNTAKAPGRYNIWMMIDSSGSMEGSPMLRTKQVAIAIAKAIGNFPNIRAKAFGWTGYVTGYVRTAEIKYVWTSGESPYSIGALNASSSTPDSATMTWAADNIVKDCRNNEQPVIIMLSDGAGNSDLNERVAKARKRGVHVYSVSLGVSEEHQRAVYGSGNYINCGTDINAVAGPLAKMIAKLAQR